MSPPYLLKSITPDRCQLELLSKGGADYRCVTPGVVGGGDGGGGSNVIPKTGAPYTGTHNDPGLADVKSCPDNTPQLEPNDAQTSAVDLTTGSLSPKPDTSPGKLTMQLDVVPRKRRV